MKPGLILMAALLLRGAMAQAVVPEVRGIIHEVGSTTGIPGVEVGLYQFAPNEQKFVTLQLLAKTFTDGVGAFSLKPDRIGEFQVFARKDGYQDRGGFIVTLSANAPVQTASMSLVRPGSLTGRVVDSDGKPMANFPVSVETVPIGGDVEAITDNEGFFWAKDLLPGSWVVHIQPKRHEREELVEYSAAEFKVIDEEAESSYWPGGVDSREGALPVPVASGGSVNVGTIRVRKIPSYRVHVSLAGECAPNERWIYRVIGKSDEFPPIQEQFGGCRKDFLLTGLKPGSHTLAVWVGRDVKAWGLVPFTITNANVEATLRLTPSISVSGQVKAAEGHTLAELGPVQVSLRPEDRLGVTDWATRSDGVGAFSFKTVAWPQQMISVDVEKPGTYVREIRYNGLPIKGPRVDMVPGARFEIELDTGAATLTGRVQRPEYLFVVRDGFEPFEIGGIPPFQFIAGQRSDQDTATISNLPPGTYRVLTANRPIEDEVLTPEQMALRVSRAEKVTVEANETKTVNVKK